MQDGSDFMAMRLTWEQIQEKYPDQWVGLTEVKSGRAYAVRGCGNVMRQFSLNLDKKIQKASCAFGEWIDGISGYRSIHSGMDR